MTEALNEVPYPVMVKPVIHIHCSCTAIQSVAANSLDMPSKATTPSGTGDEASIDLEIELIGVKEYASVGQRGNVSDPKSII